MTWDGRLCCPCCLQCLQVAYLGISDSKMPTYLIFPPQTHSATSTAAALPSVRPQTWDTHLTSPSAHAVSISENLSVLIAKYKQNQPLLSTSDHHWLLQRQTPGPALLLDPPAQRNSQTQAPPWLPPSLPLTDAPPLLGPLLPGSLGSVTSCSNVTFLSHPSAPLVPSPTCAPPCLLGFQHAVCSVFLLTVHPLNGNICSLSEGLHEALQAHSPSV